MQPDDVTPHELLSDLLYTTQDDHSNHIGGLNVLYADGSVHFLSATTTLKQLLDIISRDGGESITDN